MIEKSCDYEENIRFCLLIDIIGSIVYYKYKKNIIINLVGLSYIYNINLFCKCRFSNK